MTRRIQALAAFVTTLALFYLLGAFVAWNWDAAQWTQGQRLLCGVPALVFGLIVADNVGVEP